MRSHDRTTTTGRALAPAIAAVLVALAVTACGQNALSPDPAACKTALQAQYLKAPSAASNSLPEPATCKSLPQAEVQRFAAQIRAAQ